MQETMQGALEKEIGTELKSDVAINNGSFKFATFKTSEVGEQQFSHKLHNVKRISFTIFLSLFQLHINIDTLKVLEYHEDNEGSKNSIKGDVMVDLHGPVNVALKLKYQSTLFQLT